MGGLIPSTSADRNRPIECRPSEGLLAGGKSFIPSDPFGHPIGPKRLKVFMARGKKQKRKTMKVERAGLPGTTQLSAVRKEERKDKLAISIIKTVEPSMRARGENGGGGGGGKQAGGGGGGKKDIKDPHKRN